MGHSTLRMYIPESSRNGSRKHVPQSTRQHEETKDGGCKVWVILCTFTYEWLLQSEKVNKLLLAMGLTKPVYKLDQLLAMPP